MAETWQQIITDALTEVNAMAVGEDLDPSLLAIGKRYLNRIIDSWQARKAFAYSESFTEYTLVPGLQPHTIGPGAQITATSLTANVATYTAPNDFNVGDFITAAGCTNGAGVFNVSGALVIQASPASFQVSITSGNVGSAAEIKGIAVLSASPIPTWLPAQPGMRPPKIDGASLVLTDVTPNVDSPILNIRDAAWWNNQRVKSLTTNVPTDLYPQYSSPLVNLFFWPVPDFPYGVRLQTRSAIQQVSDVTQVALMPQGYSKALMLTLGEELTGPVQKQMPADLPARAMRARADAQINNAGSPRTASADYGTRGRPRGDFNYYSGMPQ